MTANTGSDRPPFVRTIRERTGAVDAALLLAVPAVLVAAFLLPAPLKRSFVFEYTDPSAVTAFAAAFVHFDAAHLLVNLGAYALVVPVVFALRVAVGERTQFYATFATFVVVFPGVLSYLNLAVLRSSITFGFSGVVMAFAGYLPLALADCLDTCFDVGPRSSVAPMLVFLTLGLISALSVQSVVPGNSTVLLGTSGLVLAALLAALLYGVSAYEHGANFARNVRTAAGLSGYFELCVVALLLTFALPFVAFPTDPTVGDGAVNLYVHLLGYALGFLVTYATTELQARVLDAR